MSQTEFRVEYQFRKGEVRVLVEGIEVMCVLFASERYADALFEKLKESESFIPLSKERRRKARERLAKKGAKLTDDQVKKFEELAARQLELKLIKDSIEPAVKRADDNLPNIVRMIWEKVMQATAFVGANELRDILEVPEQKYSARKIKEGIFRSEWELIKPLVGVKHGGERKRKQPVFTWNKDKAKEFFKTVQALPHISKKPLWEYAAEQLHENDYAAEIVTWLQSNQAFSDSPEQLLKDAASVWRTFEEEGKNIPAESKPLAFAFRHACYKLGYSAGAYNTLRTRYYEGKKAQDSIDKP